ncbi:MAG: D-glycero-beta-D-manno-heptose-7-phosphate kinase [Fidelibacterota bacterium]
MNSARYKQLEEKFPSKTVIVIGDLMLDNYLWGSANRISPEAPVPVVKIESTSSNPGGAGNVAYNLSSLGARVSLCGVVGDDRDGGLLRSLLQELGIDTHSIAVDPGRPTTVKTRIIAQGQQVVRTDWENLAPVTDEVRNNLLDGVKKRLESCDAVILEDYDKGLLDEGLSKRLIRLCLEASIPVYVDPKFKNFSGYEGATLIKPNLEEAVRASGIDLSSWENMERAGPILREKLKCDLLLITLGAKGMSLFDGSGHHPIPTTARSVHDVSGAGDTVIAVFCLAHISGASPREAATVANFAAGRVCEEVGVVPITRESLHEIITDHSS